MAYLEMGTRFWRIELPTRGKQVTTTYGKIGANGATTVKDFSSNADAKAFLEKQIGAKKKKGYVATKAVAPSGGRKRKTAPAVAAAAPAKRPAKKAKPTSKSAPKTVKAGLSGAAAAPSDDIDDDADSAELTVDSGLAALDPKIAKAAKVHGGDMAARLALIDPSKNSDKYYILQLIEAKKKYYVYRRNGRTGTSGQAQLDGPFKLDEARTAFNKLFKQKSGQSWDTRDHSHIPANAKHYRYLKSSGRSAGTGTWEYHLTRDPLGKPDGWYSYDADAGDEVEELYQTCVVDGNTAFAVRYVASESSGYTYRVDLSDYTQTNTMSGKTRSIRRV
mmetsp:Transcript_4537/g.11627  ORF Transcript_4537/g.11627 Transcript_4537/m.11627 type:complete len:333 (-) Transcript_4537:123-1121(-)